MDNELLELLTIKTDLQSKILSKKFDKNTVLDNIALIRELKKVELLIEEAKKNRNVKKVSLNKALERTDDTLLTFILSLIITNDIEKSSFISIFLGHNTLNKRNNNGL